MFLTLHRKTRGDHELSGQAPVLQFLHLMKFFRRSLCAWIALLGIVFSQLAVSAYACPVLHPASAPAQVESQGDMAGMPCAEMDIEQPALCGQHCDQGNQNASATSSLEFQPVLFLLLIVPALNLAEAPSETYVQAPLLARITSPPPLWRSGRLRI